ncbi:MAG: hypothetical protein EOP83_12305 [Verrucomicrobiaceae bacterium]|nr:MAG: hypothetical protein EOP83_12305 [Verrucomicrobiaceae bacterium]
MACKYAIRPNFDHMVQLRVFIDYIEVKTPPQMNSSGHIINIKTKRRRVCQSYMVVNADDKMDYKFLQSDPESLVTQWLASDAAQGQWTFKYFLNRILVSFSDKDTAFAFKMRWL